MKARYDSKQKQTASKTVVAATTDHEDLHHMTDYALRHLLSTLVSQCGESMTQSTLKIKNRNVLIAAIIDRRDTIDKAMGDIVSRPLVLSDSDDSDSDEFYSDEDWTLEEK